MKINSLVLGFILILILNSSLLFAHGKIDITTKLVKKHRYLTQYQQAFPALTNSEDKLDNLKQQIGNMQSSILLLQHRLVKRKRGDNANDDLALLKYMKVNLEAMKMALLQLEVVIAE